MVNFDLDFSNPQWYLPGDIFSLTHPPSLQFPFDMDLPLLSPPVTTSEQSATPSYPNLPSEPPLAASSVDQLTSDLSSPELPFTGPSVIQPPAGAKPTPLPTPQAPVQQLTLEQISNFFFCPYTEGGRICGEVNWKCSANKAVYRHMKDKHLTHTSGSTVWKCPNPKCHSKGHPFKRKDLLLNHRTKSCNPRHLGQDPAFIPLPDIVEGSDAEVRRWINAAAGQRKAIRQKLRAGIPWSVDLLQPVHL